MKDNADYDTYDWVDEELMGDIDDLRFDEEVNWDICPTCGHENEEDSIFCSECGTRLRDEDE